MSTSGSTNFGLRRDELCRASLRAAGVVDPTAEDMAVAQEALNVMIKSWQTQDLFPWKRVTSSHALTQGTGVYTMGPGGEIDEARPRKVLRAGLVQGGAYTPLLRMSQAQYDRLPQPDLPGSPDFFDFWPGLPLAELRIFPVPDEAGLSVRYTWQKPLDDFDAALDDPDLPEEVLMALKWGLASELIPEFDVPSNLAQVIAGKAASSISALTA